MVKSMGKVLYYFKNGDIIKCTGRFINGNFDGEVLCTYKNGKTKTHNWNNGKVQ
jgi:antitoxin component YwqK of YwqJK toxin-antitoxin module